MDNNIFDKEVAKNLRNLRVQYDSSSWNRLERKLDSKEGDDVVFDRIIAGKLKGTAIPVGKASFEEFEKKTGLSNKGSYWGKYYKYFGGVAAALILFFLGSIYISGSKNHSDLAISNIPSVIIDKNSNKDLEASIKGRDTNDFEKEVEEVFSFTKSGVRSKSLTSNMGSIRMKGVNRENVKAEYVPDDFYGNGMISNNFGLTFVDNYSNESNGFFDNLFPKDFSMDLFQFEEAFRQFGESLNIWNGNNNEVVSNTSVIVKGTNTENNELNTYVDSEIQKSKLVNSRTNRTGVLSSSSIANNEMGIPSIKKEVVLSDVIQERFGDSFVDGVEIKAYASPNVYFIQTPNDVLSGNPGYSQVVQSLKGGMAVSYTKGKDEFEAGVGFGKISYSPRRIPVMVDGSKLYLNNIKSSDVEIPVSYKRHFYQKDKLDIYSIAGATVNFRTKNEYEFIKEDKGHKLPFLAEDLKDDPGFRKTHFANRKYAKGVRDGGKLKDSSYASLNIGLGVKRIFGKGISVFFEPQYNYMLGEFGPNKDHLSSVDFKIGVSKSFNL